jgi:D-lactate dehydrogenase (cytochrome)
VSELQTDPDLLRSFLSDAAHVPGGFAAGIAFPRTPAEMSEVLRSSATVLPIGAQSSLTGGATPRGDVLLSTRALTGISVDVSRRLARVGAGLPLRALQERLAADRLWYPPAPTYDGASVGGTAATNAAGAATFKYGTTRRWIHGLTVVLANGGVLSLTRGDITAGDRGFAFAVGGEAFTIPPCGYVMPDVAKLSAGYFSNAGMDLVDLFVGSEGTLGAIADVTLRVIPRPRSAVALVTCDDGLQALRLTRELRDRAQRTWRGDDALDVAAIELMDARSLGVVADAPFSQAGTSRPDAGQVLLLVQLEVGADVDSTLEAFAQTLTQAGVASDPIVALPGDEAAANRLFALREAVPAAVNARVAAAREQDQRLQKTAGDFIVPFDRLEEALALYRGGFESRQLDYAIWGHVSDGNLHPNVMPRSIDEMERGRDALLEMAERVIRMGGSPLAEHGVGRSELKQRFLRDLYGASGIDEMRAVKAALDPGWKLAPGVLFPPSSP